MSVVEHHRCDYCGTSLDEDENEVVDGRPHHASQCREYVYGALQATKKKLAKARKDLSYEKLNTQTLYEALVTVCGENKAVRP